MLLKALLLSPRREILFTDPIETIFFVTLVDNSDIINKPSIIKMLNLMNYTNVEDYVVLASILVYLQLII